MKKLLLCLLAIAALASCKKDKETETPTTQVTANTITAKIDGTTWIGSTNLASSSHGLSNITGMSNDGKTISITLDIPSFKVGTYKLNQLSTNTATYISGTNTISAFTTNGNTNAGGTVDIDEVDTANQTITGSFSFKVYAPMGGAPVSITEGTFSKLKYTISDDDNNNNNTYTDVFKVEKNGSLWTPSMFGGTNVWGNINIQAAENAQGENILFEIPAGISKGEYQLGEDSDIIFNYAKGRINAPLFDAASGKLIITKHDTEKNIIEGTFECVTKLSVISEVNSNEEFTFTNGEFSIQYNEMK